MVENQRTFRPIFRLCWSQSVLLDARTFSQLRRAQTCIVLVQNECLFSFSTHTHTHTQITHTHKNTIFSCSSSSLERMVRSERWWQPSALTKPHHLKVLEIRGINRMGRNAKVQKWRIEPHRVHTRPFKGRAKLHHLWGMAFIWRVIQKLCFFKHGPKASHFYSTVVVRKMRGVLEASEISSLKVTINRSTCIWSIRKTRTTKKKQKN